MTRTPLPTRTRSRSARVSDGPVSCSRRAAAKLLRSAFGCVRAGGSGDISSSIGEAATALYNTTPRRSRPDIVGLLRYKPRVRWAAAVFSSLLCLLCVASADSDVGRTIQFGVADDTGKYADGGGADFFDALSTAGLTLDRMTVTWDPAHPLTITEAPFLDRSIAKATAAGIGVMLAVRPARAGAVGTSIVKARHFASFVALLAKRYPDVKTFVIGNEPNQPRFWQPQFQKGRAVSALGYEHMLAASYDALKAVDPTIAVVGGVVSSRGNDAARASTNASTSPLRFIAGLGAAYRASKRTEPLMDYFGFHPYPRSNRDGVARGLDWPDAGFANLGRVKQAIWDAFHDTAQPTIETGLEISIDEVGWQTAIPLASQSAYSGYETVPVTSERAQAQVYGQLIARAECDSSIADLLFMPFIDESQLSGFQSGLVRADGTKRPSYATVHAALARGTSCRGRAVSWHHVTGVVGAHAYFGPARPHSPKQRAWGFSLRAGEDTRYSASIIAVTGASRELSAREARRSQAIVMVRGYAHANWTPRVVFPKSPLQPGRYAYVLELQAALAPQRQAVFVSKPFSVG
jgi:hypothetical protein